MGVSQPALEKRRQWCGLEFLLSEQIRRADGGEPLGVGRLVIISSSSERDQDSWTSRHLEFRHRRRAGAEMTRWVAPRRWPMSVKNSATSALIAAFL